MKTTCPHCANTYSAPNSYLNTSITCPSCKKPYTLRAESNTPPQAQPQQHRHSDKLCTRCLTIATPKSHTKGNIGMEIILWCCFILPGLLYSAWRLTTRAKVCPKCKEPNPIPLDSPAAQQLLNRK